MYGPIRGRSIPWRTIRWRPCSRLRLAGLWSTGLRLRLARLCLYWACVGGARRLRLCWAGGLGTCRRLLWSSRGLLRTSGVASSRFCCRRRPGLPVVLRLLRTILGVRRGWQRPDETTGETAEGEPGQQPEGSCLHRYGFPFRCWKNVARVGASRGRRQSPASICLRWMQYLGGRALPPRENHMRSERRLRREGIRFRI
jgi:hypothetical protein